MSVDPEALFQAITRAVATLVEGRPQIAADLRRRAAEEQDEARSASLLASADAVERGQPIPWPDGDAPGVKLRARADG